VHPLYKYSRSGDPTRESARNLSLEEVNWWLAQLFDLTRYEWVFYEEDHSDRAICKLQWTVEELMGQIKVRAVRPQSFSI
jgi:hypothetical protein